MDIYKEQLVTKKNTSKDLFKKFCVLFGTLILILACIFVLPISGLFSYYPLLNTEYEYIFTNGDLDVDKIMGKAKRKRLATFDVTFAEEFGRYTPGMFDSRSDEFNTRLIACTSPADPDAHYLIMNNPTLQHCLLVFNPNDAMVESIKEYLPRTAKVND